MSTFDYCNVMHCRRPLHLAFGASLLAAAACADAKSDPPPAPSGDAGPQQACAYPSGPYGTGSTEVVANVAFDQRFPTQQQLSLDQLRRCGEADAPKVIVIRMVAGFCGTCRWSAAHTAELFMEGVQLIDLLVRGDENAPPTPADAARWSELRGAVAASVPLLLDPSIHFRDADAALTLPAFLFVNPRTMRIESMLTNPEPEAVRARMEQTLAVVAGAPRVPPVAFPRYDGTFSRDEWELIQAMALPANFAPPPDPSDVHADDPRAAALGARLFADTGFSAAGTVACTTCHAPALAFTDGFPTSRGAAVGDRNSPSVLFSAHQKWQFWDGRVDTLWAQALGPLENDREYGSSRLAVVHRLADVYRAEFEAVYGPLPELGDAGRFPPSGRPGQPAWDAMMPADRTAVTRAFVGFGKAIASFERTLRAEDSALDRYARGDVNALTPAEGRAENILRRRVRAVPLRTAFNR